MINAIYQLSEFFKPPYDNNVVYNQPQWIDIASYFHRYSFLRHHSNQAEAIQELFSKNVSRSDGTVVSFSSLLQQDFHGCEDEELFTKMGFKCLNFKPEAGLGVVLEHPSFPGWLIKKNYRYVENSRIALLKGVELKSVEAEKVFPAWMLSPQTQRNGKIIIKAPCDVINSLRVVMQENGKNWIMRLNLDRLKAADEYLYLLPHCSIEESGDSKSFHKKVVVISKKESIVDAKNNLHHFAALARNDPDKLREIARQIALFITCNPLTDLHLYNFSFLDDDSDTLLFMDGEPIGWLADCSDPNMEETYKNYDRGFYPILGLKKLQESITEQINKQKGSLTELQAVKRIFDEAINNRVQVIIWERTWHWIKYYALENLQSLTISGMLLFAIQAVSGLFFSIFAPATFEIARSGKTMTQTIKI